MSHGVVDLGDVTVTRLGESYGPAAPATVIMPSFDPGVREEFGPRPSRSSWCRKPTKPC